MSHTFLPLSSLVVVAAEAALAATAEAALARDVTEGRDDKKSISVATGLPMGQGSEMPQTSL